MPKTHSQNGGLQYDYTIEYKKGAENQVADSLSHKGEVYSISIYVPSAEW